MTGAEFLVLKGKNVLWVKARHDGQDSVEFLKGFKFSIPFSQFGSTYYQWRRGRWQMTDDLDQIQSDYQKIGFKFIRKVLKSKDIAKFHQELEIQAYRELRKKHRNSAFECGYGDYQWLVDYDLKKIYRIKWKNGEPVWNRKKQAWDYPTVYYAESFEDALKKEEENTHLYAHACTFECPSLKYFEKLDEK